LQVLTHDVPSHETLAFGSVGQGVQRLPQVAGAASETQTPLQRWKASLQVHAWATMSHVSAAAHWVSSAQPGLHCPLARSQ
jgi:hypothetical protein